MNYKEYTVRVYANGTKRWYLHGKRLTEEEFARRTAKEDPCEGRVVEIDGKRYKLTPVEKGKRN